jgi:hypothetical protein
VLIRVSRVPGSASSAFSSGTGRGGVVTSAAAPARAVNRTAACPRSPGRVSISPVRRTRQGETAGRAGCEFARRLVCAVGSGDFGRLAQIEKGGELIAHLRRHLIEQHPEFFAGRNLARLGLKKIFLDRLARFVLTPAMSGPAIIDALLRPDAKKPRIETLENIH